MWFLPLAKGFKIHLEPHSFILYSISQLVKNLPEVWEIQVWSLGWENPLKKGMVTHSSILDWRIPWNLAGYSPWGCKKWDMTEELKLIFWQRKAVFDKWPTSTVSVGIQKGSKDNILDVIQERLTMIDFLDTIER